MKAGPKLQTRANSGNRAKEDASFGNYYGQILSKLDLYIHMSTKYLIVDQSEPTLVSISFKLHCELLDVKKYSVILVNMFDRKNREKKKWREGRRKS